MQWFTYNVCFLHIAFMRRGKPVFTQNTAFTVISTHFQLSLLHPVLYSTSARHPLPLRRNKHQNTIFRTHLSSGHPQQAIDHFFHFQKQGFVPDNFTISSLLKICSGINHSLDHGKQIHGFVIGSGYLEDVFVSTGLLELYLKFGNFPSARQLFDEIPNKDVIFWTAMISGLARNGLGDESLDIFSQMLKEKKRPNEITITSVFFACSQLGVLHSGKAVHGFFIRNGFKIDLILETSIMDMYLKCKSLSYARRVFDRMTEKNSVSWNTIIYGYAVNESFLMVLQLFSEMIHSNFNIIPKSATLASVLQACAGTGNLRYGREIHGNIIRFSSINEPETFLENALIDMYVKSGDLDSSLLLFNRMTQKNLITWTTIIMAYGMYGLSREALAAFDEMRRLGVRPDGVTFIALLSACSHGGLVDEGWGHFISMQRNYGIEPEMKHYACLVDLYGRAGLLKQAYDFIQTMPIEPSEIVWAALLAACRNHRNSEFGELAAKKALELDPYNVGNYILLSHIYADYGRWEDAAKVRLEMKDLGLKPVTSQSWVEVKRKVYMFRVRDSSNPYSDKIYRLLETLEEKMTEAGLVPDTSGVVPNVGNEDKTSSLCGHSEKLALCFGLIMCGGEVPIRISKNLRVCRNCHEAFKFISSNVNREIILRDPNRYHRFIQGQCSCHDYW